MIRFHLASCLGLTVVAVCALAAATPTHAVLSTTPPAPVTPADPSASALTSFGANEKLDSSGTFTVQEYITVQPGANPPASVAQRIPVTVNDDQGNALTSQFRVIGSAAYDSSGKAIAPAGTITASNNGSIATITFPLGKTAGLQKFGFEYSLVPVVLAGPDADVFKVSATGIGWSLPIQAANVILNTPGHSPKDLTCYTGASGSTTSNCRIVPASSTSNLVVTDAPLNPGDSLTLFTAFPRHSFSAYYNSWHVGLLLPWAGGALIVIAALIVLAVWLLRRRFRHSHNGSSADS